MHKLEELKDMLCRELEEYGERDSLDIDSLDIVDKLAHSIKNLSKIIDSDGESYSYRGRRMDDVDRYSMRGRRNAKRDSMGRYSSADMAMDLRRLMDAAPDERTRMELERMMQKYE